MEGERTRELMREGKNAEIDALVRALVRNAVK